MPNHWRIILSPPAFGAWNMALDEAILESAGGKISLPTLRLYAWEPACLSLGYAQSIKDVDRTAVEQKGWNIVRRPTGGRAVLHADELTYSVMTPLDNPIMKGGVLESYCRLAQGLLASLRILGIHAEAKETNPLPDGAQPNAPICFEVPSNYEITVSGKKLIGSAQARRREGVLQHGSIPLTGDLARITEALQYHSPLFRQKAAERLLDHATTIEMILHQPIEWGDLASAIQVGFQDSLDIEFTSADPSASEIQRAEELVLQKYANQDWIERI